MFIFLESISNLYIKYIYDFNVIFNFGVCVWGWDWEIIERFNFGVMWMFVLYFLFFFVDKIYKNKLKKKGWKLFLIKF